MGSRILDGARIGAGSLAAAGAVVGERLEVPPGSLVVGVPAKVNRSLSDQAKRSLRNNADSYERLAADYAEALAEAQPQGQVSVAGPRTPAEARDLAEGAVDLRLEPSTEYRMLVRYAAEQTTGQRSRR
jgi:hypothetical protein